MPSVSAQQSMASDGRSGCTSTGSRSQQPDIDGAKRIFRNRAAIKRFFSRNDLREGDAVRTARRDEYEYEYELLPLQPAQ
jgi:hypothetical protein